MKYCLLLLLFSTALLAQVPAAPTNLRVSSVTADADIVYIPVVQTNGSLVAYWYNPPYIIRTNWHPLVQSEATMWVPEFSTNGVTWSQCANQLATLPERSVRELNQPCLDCLNMTETGSGWLGTNIWQVRIRRVAY